MTNHLNPSQKTPLRQYFDNIFILQGFQPLKNATFRPFSPSFRNTITIPYNKKMQKPLCLLRFKT